MIARFLPQRSARLCASGFTLMEIMVVVVIVGILASLVVPKLVHRPEQAKGIKATTDIRTLESSVELYRLDHGLYPTQQQGLDALVHRPQLPPVPPHWQPTLKRIPRDPWGKPYRYRYPGEHGPFDIFTVAPDQRVIGNWDENAP